MRESKADSFHPVPANSARRAVLLSATTYLAKIAILLREAPNQMLTFSQLMDRLQHFLSVDKKCVKHNIRVCLSTHSCFIKVPIIPDLVNSKKNYWKLDCSQITGKMVRRHFKRLLPLFPELASKVEMNVLTSLSERSPDLPSPEPASCSTVQVTCEVKFTGPFSIESLLKRDSPPAGTSRAPLCCVGKQPSLTNTKRGFSSYPVQPLILQVPACFSHISSTRGANITDSLLTGVALEPIRRIPVHTDPSFSCVSSDSRQSFATYSVPTFTKVISHVW